MYDDEFSGQGGSYIVDKKGKRVRVEETAPAVPDAPVVAAELPAEIETKKSNPTVKSEV